MKKTTNRLQFRAMFDAMEQSPDIAKNMSKVSPELVRKFWDDLQFKLNKYGPPVKAVSEWKKVWSDQRSYLKKKLALNNKVATATGGGPHNIQQLTTDEEEVDALIQLRESAEWIPEASCFGPPIPPKPVQTPSFDNLTESPHISSDDSIPQPTTSSKIQDKRKQSVTHEKSSNDMKRSADEAKENFGELNSNVKRIYQSLNKIQEQQKQHFEDFREHFAEMRYIAKEKLQVKRRLLELELERRSRPMDTQ